MERGQLHSHIFFLLVFPVVFLMVTCLAFAVANAADVTLAWDANSEQNLAGYKLYYDGDSDTEMYQGLGAVEGDSPIVIDVEDLADEDAPSFTITGLEEGQYYYFALTAFDKNGMESGYSEEVGVLIDSESSSESASGGSDSGGGGIGCFISGTMSANQFSSPMAGTGLLLLIAFSAMMGIGCPKRK